MLFFLDDFQNDILCHQKYDSKVILDHRSLKRRNN